MKKNYKFKASVPRHMYWANELKNSRRCPKCKSMLEKEYHSYMIIVKAEEDAFIAGNDNGYFCKNCPVVVLDNQAFAETVSLSINKKSFYISVRGIIDFDAVPEDKRHIPLGEDDNPIPLVEFINNTNPEEHENFLTDKSAFNLGLGMKHKCKSKKPKVDEKELLEKAIDCEFKKDYDNAFKCIAKTLEHCPISYHALFLKARISGKIGEYDLTSLKKAFEEAIRQDASEDIFELIKEEMKKTTLYKDYYLTSEWLSTLIEKDDRILEKAFGFSHYVELMDELQLGEDQEHELIVEALFDFVDSDLKVIKTDDGTIKEIFDMAVDKIKRNLLLLGDLDGAFYDDNLDISYTLLGGNFYACVHSNMLMFSAKEGDINKMTEILNKYGLKYHEPYKLREED